MTHLNLQLPFVSFGTPWLRVCFLSFFSFLFLSFLAKLFTLQRVYSRFSFHPYCVYSRCYFLFAAETLYLLPNLKQSVAHHSSQRTADSDVDSCCGNMNAVPKGSQSYCKLSSWLVASVINITYGLSMFQFADNLDPAAFPFPPYGHHIIENT